MQPLALLDTDILSELLKGRNAAVQTRAMQYSDDRGALSFSSITRYEILRGYKALNATQQLDRFASFCEHAIVVGLSDEIFDRAAELWALARNSGRPCNDADLLIAATAIEQGYVLVSGNRSHFNWIPSLILDDWRNP